MIPRVCQPLQQPGHIEAHELAVVFENTAGDKHRIDVRGIGADHDCGYWIDDRRDIYLIRPQQNDVRLFAGRDRADL